MNSDQLTIQRLTKAIQELDCHLPRGEEMPDDYKPAWCHVFCAGLDSPAGECCGICAVFGETTRNALDKAFS